MEKKNEIVVFLIGISGERLLFLGGLMLWRHEGMKDVCEAGARLGLTQIFASEEGEVTRSVFIHIR